jgi:membrane protease YdiL (CAAX protease family)
MRYVGRVLPAKPWKLETITRLLVSVFLCVYVGVVGMAALQFLPAHRHGGAKFWSVWCVGLLFLIAAFWLVRRPWRIDALKPQLAALMTCFYGGMILGTWAQKLAGADSTSVLQMILAAVSFQGATLVLTHCFLREHQIGWAEAFGLTHHTGLALLSGAALSMLFLPIAWSMQWGIAQLLTRLHLGATEQQAVQTLQMANTWQERVALAIITILLVPPAEEALFRGILYPWIKQLGFPRLALWGTSLLFAAIHMNLLSLLPLALLALVLTTLYERTANLLAPIAAHALFNASNFVLLLLIDK